MRSGIYSIYCEGTGKYYVGQSVDIKKRIQKHFSLLEKGEHKNKGLQRDYDRYGYGSFKVKVEKIIEEEYLNVIEGYYIELYDSIKKGYNQQDMKKRVRVREERGYEGVQSRIERVKELEIREEKGGVFLLIWEYWLIKMREWLLDSEEDLGDDVFMYSLNESQKINTSFERNIRRVEEKIREKLEQEIKGKVYSVELVGVEVGVNRNIESVRSELEERVSKLMEGRFEVEVVYGGKLDDRRGLKRLEVRCKN